MSVADSNRSGVCIGNTSLLVVAVVGDLEVCTCGFDSILASVVGSKHDGAGSNLGGAKVIGRTAQCNPCSFM